MKINTTDLALYAGSLRIGSSRGATITLNMDTIDCTTKDSAGWKEVLGGLRSGSFEVEGLIDYADAFGSKDVAARIFDRAPLSIVFSTEIVGDTYYHGSVFVTSWSGSSPGQEEAATWSASMELNGQLGKSVVTE